METLIDYLQLHKEEMDETQILKAFEDFLAELVRQAEDPQLERVLTTHGWTGSSFAGPLDAERLLEEVLNHYLSSLSQDPNAPSGVDRGRRNALDTTDQLLPFCPRILLEVLRGVPFAKKLEPRQFSIRGVCMLVDISGFSKFSGAMCANGIKGLDGLREVTNGILGHYVSSVYKYGGDVIAFAGDALICAFEETESSFSSTIDSLSVESAADEQNNRNIDCSFRALQCACALRTYRHKNLSTHIGVSYGEMKMALLGGLEDRWVYVVAGSCVHELADCLHEAGPQQVAVTAACMKRVDDCVEKSWLSFDSVQLQVEASPCPDSSVFLVHSVTTQESPREQSEKKKTLHSNLKPKVRDSRGKLKASSGPRSLQIETNSKSHMSMRSQDSPDLRLIREQRFTARVASFVPQTALSAISSATLDHIGELRVVTSMFLSVDSYEPTAFPEPISLQPFFSIAQEVLLESGGFLRQFLVDDKGCVLIAMWGMPFFNYANNCARALYCAVSLLQRAKAEVGIACSIGVTTGIVYCGTIGSSSRRDYAGIGTDVNISARLMSRAEGRVLLDQRTYEGLGQEFRLNLSPAEEMKLKGLGKPVTPYFYCAQEAPRVRGIETQGQYRSLVRKSVRDAISNQLDKIANTIPANGLGNSPVMRSRILTALTTPLDFSVYFTVVIGPHGTGKASAAEYFRYAAAKRHLPFVFIRAEAAEEGVPYGVARKFLLEILGRSNLREPLQLAALVDELVDTVFPVQHNSKGQIIEARATLSAVLGLDISEDLQIDHSDSPSFPMLTELESSGTKSSFFRRSRNETFYRVVSFLLRHRPIAVIIENAHFCDELSWMELRVLSESKEISAVFLVTLVSRFSLVTPQALLRLPTRIVSSNQLKISSDSGCESPIRSKRKTISIDQQSPSRDQSIDSSTSRNGVAVLSNTDSLDLEDDDLFNGDLAPPALNRTPPPPLGIAQQNSSTVAFVRTPKSELPPPVAFFSPVTKYNLQFLPSEACSEILQHKNTQIVELTALKEDEVREILEHALSGSRSGAKVSSDLVRQVLMVSSGNAFWCRTIATGIAEMGMTELEEAVGRSETRNNSLKSLVLCRLERLTVEQQLVLKHGSALGNEFSPGILLAVLPDSFSFILTSLLGKLVEQGFLKVLDDSMELQFEFQNDLIQSTLYDLLPPSDAEKIHLGAAQFIESTFSDNLRPYYHNLAGHYKHIVNKRGSALHYEMRAAEQVIERGGFADAVTFLRGAVQLCLYQREYEAVVLLVDTVLIDLNLAVDDVGRSAQGLNRLRKDYTQLKTVLEEALQQLRDPEVSLDGVKVTLSVGNQAVSGTAPLKYTISRNNMKPSLYKGMSSDMSKSSTYQTVSTANSKVAPSTINLLALVEEKAESERFEPNAGQSFLNATDLEEQKTAKKKSASGDLGSRGSRREVLDMKEGACCVIT